jgi:hypothetical protein
VDRRVVWWKPVLIRHYVVKAKTQNLVVQNAAGNDKLDLGLVGVERLAVQDPKPVLQSPKSPLH